MYIFLNYRNLPVFIKIFRFIFCFMTFFGKKILTVPFEFRFYSTEARRGKAFQPAAPASPQNGSLKVSLTLPPPPIRLRLNLKEKKERKKKT